MFQADFGEKNEIHVLGSTTFFPPDNHAIIEMMWKSVVELERPRWQYGACALNIGYLSLQTHSQNIWYLLLFHCNKGCTNAPVLPYTYIAWLVLNIALCEFRSNRLMWTDAFRSYYYVTLRLEVVSIYDSPKRDDLPLQTIITVDCTVLLCHILRSRLQNSKRRWTILRFFREFISTFQANSEVEPHITTLPLPSTLFLVHCWLIIKISWSVGTGCLYR